MEGIARRGNEADGRVSNAGGEVSGPQRQQWANGTEFLMSLIALTVGLGNIWKFPYMAYSYGGSAFLIPYLLIHLVIGKPMYYLEMCIGQFVSRGPVKVWALSPALKGLGYGQMFVTSMILLYYGSLMALAGFYFIQSFRVELPWATCSDEWGDECFGFNENPNSTNRRVAPELYFYNYILNEPDNIDDGIGVPDWRLTTAMLVGWISVFLVVIRGVRSSGKAAYFLALFPYVGLIALLIRGATLPGAGDGIQELFEPKWDELLNAKVWTNAMIATFFSLNIFFGTLIMYSSYNDFKHNVYRDSMIVTTLDTCTSVLAACTVYCILGNLNYTLEKHDIEHVLKGGPGLVFVVYSDAIASFDAVPQFFAVLFFLMLYVLGVGTAVSLLILVITVIRDDFPNFNYLAVAVVTSILGFLGGLVYVTPGGQYILTLVDHYGINFPILVLGTIEIVGLAWIYGVNNLCDDLEFMLGLKTGIFCRISWLVTPLLMIVAVVYSFVIMEPEEYNGQPFPTAAYVAGWILFGFAVAQVPLWTVIVMYKKKDESLLETVKSSFLSSELWRPQNDALYEEWQDFKEKRRIERRDDTLWQRILRTATGHSPQRSGIVESSNTLGKY